jgi:hypothetical protein
MKEAKVSNNSQNFLFGLFIIHRLKGKTSEQSEENLST